MFVVIRLFMVLGLVFLMTLSVVRNENSVFIVRPCLDLFQAIPLIMTVKFPSIQFMDFLLSLLFSVCVNRVVTVLLLLSFFTIL